MSLFQILRGNADGGIHLMLVLIDKASHKKLRLESNNKLTKKTPSDLAVPLVIYAYTVL